MGTLNLYLDTIGSSSTPNQHSSLFQNSVNQGQKWIQAFVNVTSRQEYTLAFEAVIGSGYLSDIAIDDITLKSGLCPATPPSSQLFQCTTGNSISALKVCNFQNDCPDGSDEKNCGNCTFDNSQCGWIDSSAGSFRWTRHNNGTETGNTGPRNDHTRNNPLGFYMYVDSNFGQGSSRFASLRSPTLRNSASTCQMTFWYHMYGRTGTLFVSKVVQGQPTSLTYLGRTNSNQWQQRTVNIGQVNQDFYIQFRGSKTLSLVGDISIDDISFQNCGLPPIQATCGANQFQCTRGSCVDNNRLCDFTNDCGDNSDESSCSGYPSRCAFDLSFCDWTQGAGDSFDWSRRNSPTPTAGTGPTHDHTTGLRSGGFAYIETSRPRKVGDTAILLSSAYNAVNSGCYFVFYYMLNGRLVGNLNVYLRQNGGSTPLKQIFSTTGNRGDIWDRAFINIQSQYPFQIVIQATVGGLISGDIAIDDTVFSKGCVKAQNVQFPGSVNIPPNVPSGQCQNTAGDFKTCGPCDFESGMCGWVDRSNGRFNFSRHSATQNKGNIVGPSLDHTKNSAQGYYVFVEGSQGVFYSTAILQSPMMPPSASTCELYFYYNMYGANVGTLTTMLFINGTRFPIDIINGNQGQGWHLRKAYIGQRIGAIATKWQVKFYVRPGRSFAPSNTNDIAIDDISFVNCAGTAPNISCNFDSGLCNWVQAVNDDFQWTVNKGTTRTSGTGPSRDHTSGSGQYIYIETSYPRKRGNQATLDSPTMPPTPLQGNCLSFWYYMFGPTIGSLRVYLTTSNNRVLFWSKNGTQGDKWTQAYRTINSSIDYKISLTGIVGKGPQGDIAIDDVTVSPGPCPLQPGCDFESGFCDWKQSSADDFDWTIGNNGTTSVGTGPPFDHTYQSSTGHYAYIETSGRQPNNRAVLLSPMVTSAVTTTKCMQFWYHMYGKTIGSLNIYIQRNNSQAKQIWSRTGNQQNMWRHGQVTIYQYGVYSIMIEAVRGLGYQGDIAIDDVVITNGACAPVGTCNFEQGTCGWTNAITGDDFDWTRDFGGTNSARTGPKVDHTLGTSQGHYMYIETSGTGRRIGEKAWFVSDILKPLTSGCLKFWYHMYGAGIGKLNVYQQLFGSQRLALLWSSSSNHGNVWLSAQVAVRSSQEFTLTFEGVYGGNYTGDIAIDDVVFQRVGCSQTPPTTPTVFPPSTTRSPYPPTAVDCNFENGICLWSQDKNDTFDWTMKTGTTTSVKTGPVADHTLQNAAGHYIYIEVSGKSPNSTARIVSPNVNIRSAGVCLKFWYNMYGVNVNRLSVYSKNAGVMSQVWTRFGNQGLDWKYAQVHITNQGLNQQLVFEGVAGTRYAGDIALDDVTFNIGDCPQASVCDFEDGICGYTQDSSDQFDWTLNSGRTNSTRTGPKADHTFQTNEGKYIYIESSAPRRRNDKARIDSPLYPATTGSCLKFWFNMYGRSVGFLQVYVKPSGASNGRMITKIGQNHGTAWKPFHVTVQSPTPFRITFEGIVGNGYQGDIALDDIQLVSGACPPRGSCDFEKDTCAWRNMNFNDTMDWERARGRTASAGTGPAADHTLNTPYGTYLYIEASSRKQGDNALLASPWLRPTNSSRCMTFWYNMYGTGIGSLNVYQRVYPQPLNQLFTLSGDQGNGWKQAQVNIQPSPSRGYNVYIRGIVGTNYKSDISIDDIVINNFGCGSLPPATTSSTCAYTCTGNNQCISSDKVCDFIPDCSDGGDEKQCGYDCTFENGQVCRWTNSSTTSFKWLKNRGATPDSNTGPSIDHTTLGPNGYYMYVDASGGGLYSHAYFTSPTLKQSASTCQMTFWYHMYGTGIGTLYIYMKTVGSTTNTRVWNLQGNQGNRWNRGVVNIGRIDTNFQILFDAKRSYSTKGDIAIDDIKFQGCGLPTVSTSCDATHNFTCGRGACISLNRVCDFTDDCGDNTDEQINTCSSYIGCNFESGLCTFSQLTDDDFDWTRRAGSTPSQLTGPARDHTLNTKAGLYLYIETSRPRTPGQKARLASQFFQPTTSHPYCTMRFYYFMFGKDVNQLAVYTRSSVNGGTLLRYRRSGNLGEYWERREVGVYSSKPFQFIIEATVGKSAYSDIAIDDISFSKACKPYTGPISTLPPGSVTTISPTGNCPTGQYKCNNGKCINSTLVCDFINNCGDNSDEIKCQECDFQSSQCGWMDSSAGRYQWDRHNGSTSTGPRNDHTYGTSQVGNYMYVDAGSGQNYGKAVLVSPPFGNLNSLCSLNFFYYKNSNAAGTLRMYLVPPNIKYNSLVGRIRIWSAFGNHGNTWNNATVGIGRRTPGYYLVLEALHSGKTVDMAVDDFHFTNCAISPSSTYCASNQFTCARKSCVDLAYVCDFSDDCGDQSDEKNCSNYVERCNFELDLCNWIQDDQDNFDWSYGSGVTSTVGTGPSSDHTYGSKIGHYMYIETSSPRKLGDAARLKSPVFSPSSSNCRIRFYYHMYGPDVNTLNLYKENYESGPMSLLWTKNGSQANAWIRAVVSISGSSPFRVVIEAVRGNGYKGDIAVDDVSFTPGCQVVPAATLPAVLTTPGPCGPGKWQCANKQCIDYSKVCDFKNDCSDNSDEAKCPASCPFSSGMCYWTNDQKMAQGNWNVASNGNPATNTGPSTDHTSSSSSGGFAVISKAANDTGKIFRLNSPMYHQAGKTCNFSLWYNIHGKAFRQFKIYIHSGGVESTLFSLYYLQLNKQQDTWQQAQVRLPGCAHQFYIIIEGISYGRQAGYIAIDDLQFSNCMTPPSTGSCTKDQYTCLSGNCVPMNLRCDLQNDCCDGSDEVKSLCMGYSQCTFEYSLCGWQQLTTDNFNWTKHRGPTSSSRTGPTQDHTTGSRSGYYLYIESSSPRKPNDTASIGLYLPRNKGSCSMRFWYHMYGSAIGGMNVYINSLARGKIKLDSVTSQQGNKWLRREVNLTSSSPYQVIIEGVVGAGITGDIAIDDVSFTPGCGAPTVVTPSPHPMTTPRPNLCQGWQFQCGDNSCIAKIKVCNFKQDCKDGSDEKQCPTDCTFEGSQGNCGYNETAIDGFDWRVGSGGDTSSLVAPSVDATTQDQNGHFLYINDNTGGHPGVSKKAQVSSPTYTVANGNCKVTFAYYFNGQTLGTLYMYILEQSVKTQLWRLSGYSGRKSDDQWHKVTVGIGHRSSPFNLIFTEVSSTYNGATAIDNIQFTDCSMSPPVQVCNTNTHLLCGNKACIPLSLQCDLTDDCGDGSDEANCGSYKEYNFENGIGDLIQSKTEDDFDWTLYSGKTPSSYTGPQWDHTMGTSSGHYLYMEASGKKYNQKTWLLTKSFYRTTGKDCRMRFYSYMYGQYVNTLSVYYRIYNAGPPTKLVLARANEQGAYWARHEVQLNVSQSFQIIIEAKVGDSYLGDIAIDDLTFTPGCQYDTSSLPNPPAGVTTHAPPVTPANRCNTVSQFQCSDDNKCINSNQVCNFVNDCADGSDELQCGKC